MSEYKNGVNAFGNMSVSKEDRAAEVKTGRAIFVDEDKYENDPDYKLKVDKCLTEGFHRVSESEGSGSSDFSTAEVTITSVPPQMGADYMGCAMPIAASNDGYEFSAGRVYAPGIYTVILYKGNCYIEALNEAGGVGLTITVVSGDAEADENTAFITGDCTITITGGVDPIDPSNPQ